MLGAIAGDIIGSVYEGSPIKTTDFPLFSENSTFTDDTVLTIAVAECLLNQGSYTEYFQKWGRKYPDAGYGMTFSEWIHSDIPQPYDSWGNGSAMRVSPIAYAFETIEEVLEEAERSATVTHSHPEGITGARATTAAIFLARTGKNKREIKDYISRNFAYDLDRSIKNIRPSYEFDVSCKGSVPEAIIAFMESENYEDAVRLAVSLGGDSDTQACIAGAIAEAYYKRIPEEIIVEAKKRLPEDFLGVLEGFMKKYMSS
jgi:ADP-ribosylglycohydrolase